MKRGSGSMVMTFEHDGGAYFLTMTALWQSDDCDDKDEEDGDEEDTNTNERGDEGVGT